ncbi:MAG: hypothetical protein JWO90_2500 [Solirubrobacterales bacterium]|nr:hypothetical protein [Solirubrobacterales bacterium]
MDPRELQRRATVLLSGLMVLIGVALVVRTVAGGGSPISIGLLLGVLFVVAGAGRIHLATRGR